MKEFSRCPSCGCTVDSELRGHHSAADCSILKYSECHVAEAVQAERERWSALIEKAIHEFEAKDPMPNAPHFSIHGIAVTLRKKQVEMLRVLLSDDQEANRG